MVNRRETPDILGELLNEPDDVEKSAAPAEATPPPAEQAAASLLGDIPSPQNQQPSRVQWEYMEVTFREYRGWRPRYVNGDELLNWKHRPLINDYLNRLGTDGWEMVGIGEQRRYEKVAYFKRIKTA